MPGAIYNERIACRSILYRPYTGSRLNVSVPLQPITLQLFNRQKWDKTGQNATSVETEPLIINDLQQSFPAVSHSGDPTVQSLNDSTTPPPDVTIQRFNDSCPFY